MVSPENHLFRGQKVKRQGHESLKSSGFFWLEIGVKVQRLIYNWTALSLKKRLCG